MITLILLICITSILVFLYKTSELMNKKLLSSLIVISLIVLVIFSILHYTQSKKPTYKHKLLTLPLQLKSKTSIEHSWLSHEIPGFLSQWLLRSVADNIVIAPIEWTYQSLNQDSIFNDAYITRFMQKTDFDQCFRGSLSKEGSTYILSYNIGGILEEGIKDSISFKMNELMIAIQKVAARIGAFISDDAFQPAVPGFTNSLSALKLTSQANENYLKMNYLTAFEMAEQAIEFDSLYAMPHFIKALCDFKHAVEFNAGLSDSAAPYFSMMKSALSKAIRLDSLDSEAHRLMGEYYIYKERWSVAESYLKTAHSLNPNNYRIYLAMSRLHKFRYEALGYSDEEQLYQKAVSLNPCSEEAHMLLSDYYLFNNNRDEAIRVLKEYLEINPQSVPALMALGKIYIVRNDAKQVMDILNFVISLEPNNSDAYYNLGVYHYNTDNYVEAKRKFTLAIDVDNHLNSHLYLAYINELEGDLDSAIEHLRHRIRMRTGQDDEFAEEARRHLYKIMHSDSAKTTS